MLFVAVHGFDLVNWGIDQAGSICGRTLVKNHGLMRQTANRRNFRNRLSAKGSS
jgi:hypothetical protein